MSLRSCALASVALVLTLSAPTASAEPPARAFRVPTAMTRLVEPATLWLPWGRVIALDGDRSLVGSVCVAGDAMCGVAAQSAEIWEYAGVRGGDGGWQKVADLVTPDGPATYTQYGSTVALAGELAFVGAPGATSSAGVVFFFERSAEGEWIYRQTLVSPTPANDARFGASLALDAERLLVGEPGRPNSGSSAGGATLFTRGKDGLFVVADQITVPTTLPGGGWGSSVGLDGSSLVLGSPVTSSPELPTSPNVGSIATFTLAGGLAAFEGFLTAPEGWLTASSKFASALSFDDDVLVVHSASGGPAGFSTFGFVDIFRRSGGSWVSGTPFIGSVPSQGSVRSVATRAGLVAVGSPSGSSFTQLLMVSSSDGVPFLLPLATKSAPSATAGVGAAVAVSDHWWLYHQGPKSSAAYAETYVRAQPLGDVAGDCDGNGAPNALQVPPAQDCDQDLVPDSCGLNDCDADGIPDPCEITLDRVDSRPGGGTLSATGVYFQGGDYVGVLACRVDVPLTVSGTLQAISCGSLGGTSPGDKVAYVAMYRDGDQDGLPDNLELLGAWSVRLALETTELTLPINGELDLAPGEIYFVGLAVQSSSAGNSLAYLTYNEPHVPNRTWWTTWTGPNIDFAAIGSNSTFQPISANLRNPYAVLRFRSPNDTNADGLPDACACFGDLDGDGVIGASDLATLLGAWGGAGGDLDGDGITGATDVALLLGAWGPC